MAKKDHTQVADRIASNALGLFHEVHGELQKANGILEEGMDADAAELKRLAERLAQAKDLKAKNETVAKKIEDLVGISAP